MWNKAKYSSRLYHLPTLHRTWKQAFKTDKTDLVCRLPLLLVLLKRSYNGLVKVRYRSIYLYLIVVFYCQVT